MFGLELDQGFEPVTFLSLSLFLWKRNRRILRKKNRERERRRRKEEKKKREKKEFFRKEIITTRLEQIESFISFLPPFLSSFFCYFCSLLIFLLPYFSSIEGEREEEKEREIRNAEKKYI